MREIKFRAWDKRVKSWIDNSQSPYVYLTLLGTFVRMRKEPCTKGLWQHETESMAQGFDIILNQFTGLLDKNGKEIYEGDIVKSSDCLYEDVGICPIQWDQERCAYVLKRGQFIFCQLEKCEVASLHLEVIGNVYENLDLIK